MSGLPLADLVMRDASALRCEAGDGRLMASGRARAETGHQPTVFPFNLARGDPGTDKYARWPTEPQLADHYAGSANDQYTKLMRGKSGATADRIWRSSAEQLAHSINWFREQYDHTCRATPVMIHKTSTLERNATAPPGTRIITTDGLKRLRVAIRAAAIALADAGTWGESSAVNTQLIHHQLTGPAIINGYGVPARRP
jgi:hypothetical protein